MKKITLLFLLAVTNCLAQNFLVPIKKASAGINHYTNRDVTYFSNTDSSLNTIITATTERDSTFNDIVTIKLDQNLNQVWLNRFSVDTEQSFDIPLATLLDANDNIYTIARSYTNVTFYEANSQVAIIKYNSDGTTAWNLNLGECLYNYSKLDDAGLLHIIYQKISDDSTTVNWHFITIDQQGQITDSFLRNDIIDSSELVYGTSYTFYYADNNFYLTYERYNASVNSNGVYEHFIKKINASQMQSFNLDAYINPTDISQFSKAQFITDDNGRMYLAYPLPNAGKFRIIKLNADGSFAYTHTSPTLYDSDLLKTYINQDNLFCALSNSRLTGTTNAKSLNTLEYDDNGIILNNYLADNAYTDALKHYPDGSVLAYVYGYFRLYNTTLSSYTQFAGYYDEATDFNKTDDLHVVVANSNYQKMYPESGIFAQVDVVANLSDNNAVLNTFTYSGEGTSKTSGLNLLADSKGNYILITEQKLGDDIYSIGGTTAPIKNIIYKYDTNFNVIWSVEVPYYIIAPNGYRDNYVITADNSIYINTVANYYNQEFRLLKISEDGEIVFDVPGVFSEKIYADQNNNINIVSTETISNSDQDFNTFITTFNSQDGSVLGTHMLDHVIYRDSYKLGADSYLYMYDGRNYANTGSKKLLIYKNLVLQSTTNLNIFGQYAGMGLYAINTDGTIYFQTFTWPTEERLNKFTLQGELTSVPIEANQLGNLDRFTSGKIVTFYVNGTVTVYNTDLTVKSTSPDYVYDGSFSPRLFAVGNVMLLYSYYDNLVKAIDENTHLAGTFKLPETPAFYNARAEGDSALILTGAMGSQLYTYEEYAWNRSFIHRYDIMANVVLNTETTIANNTLVKIYPNPSDNFINIEAANGVAVTKTQIFDLTGKLLLTSANTSIDVSSLTPSVYIIKIYTTNGTETGRIIKK